MDATTYPHLARFAAGRPFAEVAVEFMPSQPTTRHGLTSVALYPGVVDDNADEFFAWGYCWLLAAALHEATGWTFGLVERWREETHAWEWTHVGVITPNGRFLDIRGHHDRASLAAALEIAYAMPTRIRPGDFAELRRAMGMAEETEPNWWLDLLATPLLADVVRYFAAHLLGACLDHAPEVAA
ncbi:hypothetical protein [Nonomuraea sp. NPDC049141]|uniref:hypothetical protein n=1 Tax=Nonomuraea sp. NPDC049141 TaxID=3155500 RepID=UPI00340E7727